MKNLKILILLVAVSALTFYSCTDNSPIENEVVAKKSSTLRTTLNALKVNSGSTGRTTNSNPFCFEFVYPISLSYNNGTIISVSSFDGLIEVINNENPNLFIEGIVFPFQVRANGAITTINNEEEFFALIENCSFNTFFEDLRASYCFDLVFPITILANGNTVVINNQQELLLYGDNPSSPSLIEVVFPFSIMYSGQTIVINNYYEFYEMVNNCGDSDCVCTLEYAPVCVQTPAGIVEYGNFCFAQCDGYTQNDLVDCNPSTDCSIRNLSVNIGDCNTDGTYPLTIDFDYQNPPSDYFVVHNSSGAVVGSFLVSQLPITIASYVSNRNATDFLTVEFANNSDCSAIQYWIMPNCDCVCPTNFDPVCVQTPNGLFQYNNACLAMCAGYTQNDFIDCGVVPNNFSTQLGTCFTIQYPVQVQYNGAIVVVNSNDELLQYYFPAVGAIPAMNYPITVTFDGVAATIDSQATFQALISARCN